MHKYNSIKKQRLNKNLLKSIDRINSSKQITIWFNLVENLKIEATYGNKLIFAKWKIINLLKWFEKKKFEKKKNKKGLPPTKENIFCFMSSKFKTLSKKDKFLYFNYCRNGKKVINEKQRKLEKVKNKINISFPHFKRAFKWLLENKLIEKFIKKIKNSTRCVWIWKKKDLDFNELKKVSRGWKTFAINFGNEFKTNESALQDSPPSYNSHVAKIDNEEWNKYIKENWEDWKDFFKTDEEE